MRALSLLAVGLLLGGLGVAVLYAVARRLPRTWAAWGTVAAMALLIFSMVIGPVYLAPLFNTSTRLEEARRHAERAAAEDARRGYSAASAAAWLQAHQPGSR
jgi:STE24 endopeptidase